MKKHVAIKSPKKHLESAKRKDENRIEFKLSILFAAIALTANFGLVYAIQPVYEIIENDNASNITQTLNRSDTLATVFTIISAVSITAAVIFLSVGLYKHVSHRSKPEK